jgi:hypothetical protein
MTTIPERVAFLRKIHLFAKLSDDDLNDVAEALTDETHQPGDRIIAQGSRGDTFYIVYRGYVKVTRRRKNKETVLAQLVPQDYFGEEELFKRGTRTASITAVTETTVLALHRSKLGELMKRAPAVKPSFDVVIESHKLWRRLQFKWIRPDEVAYFLARKHPIMLWRALMGPLVALILPALVILWGTVTQAHWASAFAVVAVVFVALWILWLVADWRNDYYVVTNQRVVWVEKVIGFFDSRTEAPLGTVLSVGVESDAIGRILDYGNVVIRTFVGKIPFNHVGHPHYAARMIEEYWNRTKELNLVAEKEAMKDALRKRLGLPIPPKPEPPPAEKVKFSKLRRPNVLTLALSNMFKLRLEDGETVTYRKHTFVLLQQIWQPTLFLLILLGVWIWRISYLAAHPTETLFKVKETGGVVIDTLVLALPIVMIPFLAWWTYQYVDWKNDVFQVTPDQIVDIDKTPLGPEERRAAPLEGILNTSSKRVGILGNIFNFGTVYVSVGGAQLEFQDVFDPMTVQSDIDRRRMARQAAKNAATAAAERERIAEWIATYHRNAPEFQKQEEELKKPKPE